jgi:hypothetical protein
MIHILFLATSAPWTAIALWCDKLREAGGAEDWVRARCSSAAAAPAGPIQAESSCDRRTEVPEFAVNPLEPSMFVFNHPIFAKFSVQWHDFDPNFVGEAFGAKVDYRFDCVLNNEETGPGFGLVRTVTPSRHFPCRQHEKRLALETPPRCVPGFFPVRLRVPPSLQACKQAEMILGGLVIHRTVIGQVRSCRSLTTSTTSL